MVHTWLKQMSKNWFQRQSKGVKRARKPPSARLSVEALENRLAPATHIWTGATSALWSVDTNWNGGSPAGDPNAVLVFPKGAANPSNTNDLTNHTIQSITFSGSGYTLSGNSITLEAGGVTVAVGGAGPTVNLPITLGATQSWTVTTGLGLELDGVISGAAGAGLIKDGMGILFLMGTNTYAGPTTVSAGDLYVNGSQPASNVTVASGSGLGGTGTVGTITTSGTIKPIGTLHSGNVIFNAGSSLLIASFTTEPEFLPGQLNVTGVVNLSGNPTLSFVVISLPVVGETSVPVTASGGITGTFGGLPENAALYAAPANLRINYQTNAVVLTVVSLNTQTSVTSSANPSVFGQQVTFTATVTAAWDFVLVDSGTIWAQSRVIIAPTGTVTFKDGTVTLGTATLTAGQATLNTSSLSIGAHCITAIYSGDSNFKSSTSAVLAQRITGTPNQIYITQLYHDLLRRGPDGGGFLFWTGLLDQNKATHSQVATAFVHSPEFLMREVPDLYHTFLHRDADPTGLSGWTQFLGQGHTLEQLEAQIVASPEYLQRRASGNTDNFLATLIVDVYNRPINQPDRDRFGDDFSSGSDRRRVAEQVFATNEFHQDLVQSNYERFLNRSADAGGLRAAVAALQNGLPDEMVIAVIVSSPEYIARGGPTMSGTQV